MSAKRGRFLSLGLDSGRKILAYHGVPDRGLADAVDRLRDAAKALGPSAHADLLRMDACHGLRLAQDRIFAATGDAHAAYRRAVLDAAAFLESRKPLPLHEPSGRAAAREDVFAATTGHYGRLWGGFSPRHYFDEASRLLEARLRRNGVDLSWFRGKSALDAGCGGGRYTVALKRLGLREVVGADGSSEAIGVARARAKAAGVKGVRYVEADMLRLPFPKDRFDFIFSNGVLHHTTDCARGLRELTRVMRPEGRAWVYLYGRPGGLDRVTHYVARLLLRDADREVCRRYCSAIGIPGNRVFFFLDLWLTPVAESYTPEDMDGLLGTAGWSRWRRLSRGADQDMVEQARKAGRRGELLFGKGESRYWAECKSR